MIKTGGLKVPVKNISRSGEKTGQAVRDWWQTWRLPLVIFAIWRLGLIAISLWAGAVLPVDTRPELPYFIAPDPDNFIERTVGIWAHWDGQFFLHVAQFGYRAEEYTQPYFPLYPLLVKILAWPLGGQYVLAGVLVSSGLSLLTFGLFYRLIELDCGRRIASRSLICLAVYPTSYYLAACYSESLFLALTVGAFWVARRYSNWPLVGLLVGLATLTRNMGIFLLIPLGWEWGRQHWNFLTPAATLSLKERWRGLQPLATAFLVGTPLLILAAWVGFNGLVLGPPLGFLSATERWGRQSAWPWQTLGQVLEIIGQGKLLDLQDFNLYDLPFWLVIVGVWLVAIYLCRQGRLPVAYLLYFTIAILVPMSAPHPNEPLVSFPRYSLLAFPFFVTLASLRGWAGFGRVAYLLAGVLLLTLLFARFSNWYWIA